MNTTNRVATFTAATLIALTLATAVIPATVNAAGNGTVTVEAGKNRP